jgi:lipopolysaccharide/colanic/teichoic acid biosynthesis glycosyltransferase/glycosyltransferase involved in cell wall biosynthesis
MKKEQFDIVHVHTPVAAALGRVAAWAARVPIVIYTAHGFYFHERMPGLIRRPLVWLEKLLCHITHLVFTQSYEDAVTAVRKAICPEEKVLWIGNGVDIGRFPVEPSSDGARESLGLCAQDKVVGFVGRLVREKGILELIQAMKLVVEAVPDAKLLLVGDTLDSDRDRKAKRAIGRLLDQDGLASRVLFTGFVEDIPRVMAAIDLFVLPSHREGMPRTIIEAMASGKPVVATDIRGCREEVVNGLTGLLVPVKNPAALAAAIVCVLSNLELAYEMGKQGRQRACALFDEGTVLDRQVRAYAEIVQRKLVRETLSVRSMARKRVELWLKRAIDIAISSVSLIVLCLPFIIIAALIKLDSQGPVFFRQERIGKDGKPFWIWKFRTMVESAITQGLGVNFAENDPRITRVGKVLREWGVDELPQLINVLMGEMSLVGPRPTLRYQVEQYDDFQRQRLVVRPGVTSLAVVKGRNLLPWRERIKLDIWYIDNWSLWLDSKIIFKTFWAVLVSRGGVYGPGGINDDFASTKMPDLPRQNRGT